MQDNLPNITVTFLIEYKRKFLLISRSKTESNFPSLWAFPGGKCEIGETMIDTIKREVMEETGLSLSGEASFLDSYYFNTSVGAAFLVRVTNDSVIPSPEIIDYKWVSTLEDLEKFKCIPGIHNHLKRAIEVLGRDSFESLDSMNLTPEKYLNH